MPPTRDFRKHKDERRPEFETEQVVELEDAYSQPLDTPATAPVTPPKKTYLSIYLDKKYVPALNAIEKRKLNKSEMYTEILTDYIDQHHDLLEQEPPERTDTRRRTDKAFFERNIHISAFISPAVKRQFLHVAKWERADYEAFEAAVQHYLVRYRDLLAKRRINVDMLLDDDSEEV